MRYDNSRQACAVVDPLEDKNWRQNKALGLRFGGRMSCRHTNVGAVACRQLGKPVSGLPTETHVVLKSVQLAR
jgi:hypothetical protein